MVSRVDVRMDMSKTGGVASRKWAATCGHHSEVGHGAGAGEFDRVVEHVESDEKWIGDDHRKQSSKQLEWQRDRPERGRYAAQMKNSGR